MPYFGPCRTHVKQILGKMQILKSVHPTISEVGDPLVCQVWLYLCFVFYVNVLLVCSYAYEAGAPIGLFSLCFPSQSF